MDSCLVYAALESCLAQLSHRGELNAGSFARHCAARHALALSSVEQHVYVHDVLAEAAEFGALVAVAPNGNADVLMEEEEEEDEEDRWRNNRILFPSSFHFFKKCFSSFQNEPIVNHSSLKEAMEEYMMKRHSWDILGLIGVS